MTTAKPVKRPRGEGQWKLGYREPLNQNERSKRDSDGLEVRQRIIDRPVNVQTLFHAETRELVG